MTQTGASETARDDLSQAEIVTVHPPGEQALPRQRSGSGVDLPGKLDALVADLLGPANHASGRLREALEPRSATGIKALANDLEDYAAYCRRGRLTGLPASEDRLVRFIEDCEARGLKPATIARRMASLTLVHRVLGLGSEGQGERVKNALRAVRRRGPPAQRRAGAIRAGVQDVRSPPTKAITLQAMLAACDPDPPGLRDAALLSLGYESGLPVSQLLAVELARIVEQDDGSAHLLPPARGEAAEGETIAVSSQTVRRLTAWADMADIRHGPLFRRVAVRRLKARSGAAPVPLRELAWNHRTGEGQLGAKAARSARIEYAIGEHALTPAAVRLIVKRRARQAAERGFVDLQGRALDAAIAALSANSLRRGLVQDALSDDG